MSYSVKNRISEQERGGGNGNGNGTSSSRGANCCSTASSQLKIYQTFIFSVPIFFTFVLLFLFYWFYLRRRRADWSSLRMRANNSLLISGTGNDLSRCELGLKKELREMLPIIVFKESFSVKDAQCSVCLGEYQEEDRLQQIPGCGHTFHMDCIDLWLTTHTTCPLCRQSLLASSTKPLPDGIVDARVGNVDEASHQNDGQTNEDPQTSQVAPPSEEGAVAVVGDTHTHTRCDEAERGEESVK